MLVAIADGRVVGWKLITDWFERRASAETSFNVYSRHRSRGISRQLKAAIIDEAQRLKCHTLIARVAEGSHESMHLNEDSGLRRVGTLKEEGRKFGKLLDVHILQLMLD